MHRWAGQFLYFYAQYFPLVGFENFKTKSFQIKFLAGRRNPPAHMGQKSRNRRDRFVHGVAEMYAQHLFHIFDRRTPSHHQRAGASRTISSFGCVPSAPLSPTISSTRSSIVAIPATLPCSSII